MLTRRFAHQAAAAAREKGKLLVFCFTSLLLALSWTKILHPYADSVAILAMVVSSGSIGPTYSVKRSTRNSNALFISLVPACGMGCQYGNCDPEILWDDGNDQTSLSADPPAYISGPCMQEVFNHFFGKGPNHPVCRAKVSFGDEVEPEHNGLSLLTYNCRL